jgi:predicted metalloprotease with PDZ domain
MPIVYAVSLDPARHLFTVDLTWDGPDQSFTLPAWSPGSYVIRDYARQVDDVEAWAGAASAPVNKIDKATWVVDADTRPLRLRYRVYAHELSVRTAYLDDAGAFLQPTALFMHPQQGTEVSGTLVVELPAGWEVATGLAADGPSRWRFTSLDELYDCPMQLGPMRRAHVTILDREHEVAILGPGPLDPEAVARDFKQLVPVAARVFGGALPYPRYVCLVRQTEAGGGGLEHGNSQSVMVPRFREGGPEQARQRLLALIAHEYFHLWNVKRLHPRELGPFDYSHEVYTRHLWLMEGGTDYYAPLLLGRSGLWTADQVLATLAERLGRQMRTPGRFHQSLADASWDAWIKFYRPDAHSPNATVSYYERGSLAAWLLDLALRGESGGELSLDDYLRRLWERYPAGFPDSAPREMVEELGGTAVALLFDRLVDGRGDLPLAPLSVIGLELSQDGRPGRASLGLETEIARGKLLVRVVREGGPAELAGMAPGDEILALDGFRLDAAPKALDERLQWYQPGQRLSVLLNRQGRVQAREVSLEADPVSTPRLRPAADATPSHEAAFAHWLGQPWPFPRTP